MELENLLGKKRAVGLSGVRKGDMDFCCLCDWKQCLDIIILVGCGAVEVVTTVWFSMYVALTDITTTLGLC